MEIDTKSVIQETIHRFERVANKVRAMERSRRDYGLEEHLQVREIYTIANIGLRPNITVTELANAMGVTKGAASQVVGSLEKRGYIDKLPDEHDGKKVHLVLSEQGREVQVKHEKFYERAFKKYRHMVSPGQMLLFNEMLTMIEWYLDTTLAE